MAAPLIYTIFGVGGIPEVQPDDDLAAVIQKALTAQATPLQRGDVLVVTQKIVSKAEGRLLRLDTITPGPLAQEFGTRWNRDPRLIEVVLQQCQRIIRMDRGVIIAETAHGWICANAGVDASNVGGGDVVTLLPVDPSASAAAIRRGLAERAQVDVPVLVTDTFGRPWREGLTNVAIGVSGLNPLHSYIGERDDRGYPLQMTIMAMADEIAGAAELVMGKLDRVPVAVVRGLEIPVAESDHRPLMRLPELDMFR